MKTRANIAREGSLRETVVDRKRDDEERKLFRTAMTGVKPLAHAATVPAARRRPSPQARFARAGQRELLDAALHGSPDEPPITAGEESTFNRPGVPPGTLRRLRRGQYRIQDELDLHGLNLAQARAALHGFLQEVTARDLRCVRIIHGKGLRSGPGGPVLRQAVLGCLRRHARVIAFISARQVDGGTGALYVLLAA